MYHVMLHNKTRRRFCVLTYNILIETLRLASSICEFNNFEMCSIISKSAIHLNCAFVLIEHVSVS